MEVRHPPIPLNDPHFYIEKCLSKITGKEIHSGDVFTIPTGSVHGFLTVPVDHAPKYLVPTIAALARCAWLDEAQRRCGARSIPCEDCAAEYSHDAEFTNSKAGEALGYAEEWHKWGKGKPWK